MSGKARKPRIDSVAVISSHLPRRCGIGVFTSDLCDALEQELGSSNIQVVALNDVPEGYRYPPRVRFVIQETVQSDYRMAADFLNINEVDVVILQHEYGIFGGPAGAYVIRLLRGLRRPVLTTLHTVLTEPNDSQRRVIEELAELSDRLVVMSHKAVSILKETYDISPECVAYIPHGIPDVPFVDPAFYKDKFGLEGRKAILTFGLLSPSKGIEYMIRALPAVVKRHPESAYVVLGATHPGELRQRGEQYRQMLVHLVKENGLNEHVIFHNRFVSPEELSQYIGAADLYATPYQNAAQITSGTLAVTMGAGKAVVSTPYWYAEEMLAEDRGRLVPFSDPGAMSEQVIALFDDPNERNAMRKRSYTFCRNMIWPEVGRQYLELAQEVLAERRRQPRPTGSPVGQTNFGVELPEIDLRHLRQMTDDTGVLQHAIFSTPDRQHGYTTDDNARALIATLLHWDLHHEESVLSPMQTYLAFLADSFNHERKRFRNYMGYDRKWLEDMGSEDSHARALHALGVAVDKAPDEATLAMATRLFADALPATRSFSSPRAWAFAIVGIHAYLVRFRGDADARRIRAELSDRLFALFEHGTPDWPWCEDTVTYSNGRLPHALLMSGQWVPNPKMVQQALTSLKWLLEVQTGEDGQLSIIGNQGWMTRKGYRARFDQQPVEVVELAQACAEAYVTTGDDVWLRESRRCLDWFLGRNDLKVSLIDFRTGGCNDGLHPHGPNANRGAESTLAWLTTLMTMHELVGSEALTRKL